MKNLLILIVIISTTSIVLGQNSLGFNYQAMARNTNNEILVNQNIELRFIIIETFSNSEVYSELHTTTTSENGIFSVIIGKGEIESGSFINIDWGQGNYIIGIEIAVNNGPFEFLGESPIVSVPIAKYAETAGNVKTQDIIARPSGLYSLELGLTFGDSTVIIHDVDSTNELQDLTEKIDGDHVEIGIQGSTTNIRADRSATNELQEVELLRDVVNPSNSILKIDRGFKAGGPFVPVNFQDVQYIIEDTDAINELQKFQLNPAIQGVHKLDLINADGTVHDFIMLPDLDAGNELQDFEVVDRSGTGGTAFVKLSQGSAIQSIDESDQNEIQRLDMELIPGTGGTAAELELRLDPLTPAKAAFTTTVTIPDADPVNELQQLSYADGTLSLSNGGGTVEVPISPWTIGSLGRLIYDGDVSIGGFLRSTEWIEANILNAVNITTQSVALNSGRTKLDKNKLTIFSENNFEGSFGDEDGAMVLRAEVVVADQIITENGVKHFRMDHPLDDSKEIYYCSIEGPEAAAYERGTATLINGEAFVPFSEHYRLIANPNTMTVHITSLSADTYGIAVVKKSAEGIYVKELKNGKGDFSFDWEVKSVRQGYEDFEVIREK